MQSAGLFKHIMAFRGARQSWLDKADQLILRSMLALALIIVPLQIFRNFWQEPTPWAWPILLCAVLIIATCLPQVPIKSRVRLGTIAVLMLCFAVLVQMRNLEAPMSNFHILNAALIAILVLLGTRASFLALMVFASIQLVLLLTFSDSSTPQIVSLMVGYVAVSGLILGCLAAILQGFLDSENELKAAQAKLLSNQQQRDKILKSITKELATPINTLKTLTLSSELPAGIAKDLNTVSQNIGESIEDLQHHLWPESIADAATPSNCHVTNLMTGIRRQLEPLFAEEGIQLEIGRVRLPVPFYRLDGPKLRAAISALLRNIPQHSGAKHATLNVRADPLAGGIHRLSVIVTDDGCGLPEEIAQYLAQTYQADTPFKSSEVELTRVQHWLHLMGGQLQYQPLLPSGSQFVLTLHVAPVELSEQPTDHSFTLDAAAGKGLRAAIVDEDALLGRASQALMRNMGFGAADLYANADDLLSAVRTGRFYNLVFIDQYLEGETGTDLIQRLRDVGNSGPFIMMAATPTDQTRSDNLTQGASATAIKPLTSAGLYQALELALPTLTKRRAQIIADYL